MIQDIIKQANWIDIVVIAVLIRMVFIGVSQGFTIELFKIAGLVVATVLGLHYYTVFGDFLNSKWSIDLALADCGSLIVVVAFIVLLFKYIREMIFRFIKIDAHHQLNRWGGAILGLLRGFLVNSLIILCLLICHVTYLTFSAQGSLTGLKLSQTAPQIYSLTYNGLISKFFPDAKINSAIFDLLKQDSKTKT